MLDVSYKSSYLNNKHKDSILKYTSGNVVAQK